MNVLTCSQPWTPTGECLGVVESMEVQGSVNLTGIPDPVTLAGYAGAGFVIAGVPLVFALVVASIVRFIRKL